MALQIHGIHHIVLTASEPERSARFYEKILGVKANFVTETVQCIPCGSFLLCQQRPSIKALPGNRFDENRLGLDHIGFSVASRRQLEDLLLVLDGLNVVTAGIEYDPDG
jgi:catechol 2,3-dioxygenase-like lactoylglutathione lyase family enzyme